MKINMAKWCTPFGALLGFVVASSQVQATPLPPGGNVAPDAVPAAVATQLADITSSFMTPGGTTGTVREVVVREAGGTLDFLYQVTVASGSSAIVRMSAIDYSGWSTDVSAVLGSAQAGVAPAFTNGGQGPSDATRSGGVGQTVGFDFNGIGAGDHSRVLIVRTNATIFGGGVIGVTNGGTDNVPGFAPSPEPASLVLLASCFLGLGGAYAWRRRGTES